MAAEETLKAVITVEDRTAGALGAIRSRLAAFGALPQHITQRFKRLGEETGLAKVGEHAKAAGERVKGLHERVQLANLRDRPQLAVTFRSGWRWATVEGRAELAGPDDPQPWVDAEGLRLLLRAVFTAAGGEHEDWDEYDRVMAEQRRTVVLIEPTRVYSN